MNVHLFQADVAAPTDHLGERSCLHCPLPRKNRVHQVPDRADAADVEARRLGERAAA